MSVELWGEPERGPYAGVRWRYRVAMPDGRRVVGGSLWRVGFWTALAYACRSALLAERYRTA